MLEYLPFAILALMWGGIVIKANYDLAMLKREEMLARTVTRITK